MQSYSMRTKEYLSKIENSKLCCNIAMLSGMLLLGGTISRNQIRFTTENKYVAKYFRKTFNYVLNLNIDGSKENALYSFEITHAESVCHILKILKLTGITKYCIVPEIIENECCKSAFLRGAFLGGGTVIDPSKTYNMEFTTKYEVLNNEFFLFLQSLGLIFKTVKRKSNYILYAKHSETICDALTFMGAFQPQMEFLNIKIEREMNNNFNRISNGETANYDKAIMASIKQILAISKLKNAGIFEHLPSELIEIADLRLEHQDLSLDALGKLLTPPLTKSGVNHRLQKIISISEHIN